MRAISSRVWSALVWGLLGFIAAASTWNGLVVPATTRSETMAFVSGKVVVVDAGHGGPDGGAVGISGVQEKVVTLAVAKYLAQLFREGGARVIMTREEDGDLSGMSDGTPLGRRKRADLFNRVKLANESGADVLISVHANKFPQQKYSGGQTFYFFKSGPENRRLALLIQKELIRLTGNTDREVGRLQEVYLLENVKIPAVTVEVGFLSNPREERLLTESSYQKQLAWAIFTGAAKWFAGAPVPVIDGGGR